MTANAISQTLNSITNTKLQVLSKQHSDFAAHRDKTLTQAEQATDRHEKIRILLEGINSWHVKGGAEPVGDRSAAPSYTIASSSADIVNISLFLNQARQDPSVGKPLLVGWEEKLTDTLRKETKKFSYAELFGKLLMQWVSGSGAEATGAAVPEAASDGVEMDDSATTSDFENIGRKEMHEQRAQFESIVFKPLDTDTDAIEEYLENIFSSKEAQRQLATCRDRVESFGKSLFDNPFTPETVKSAIRSLLNADLLSNEKRATLQEFMRNKTVLGEVADVLNMHLFSLSSWSWPEEGVPVEMRRQLNGKYRVYMDEDILQAIFLQFIGLKWSVEFKKIFTGIYNSRAWNTGTMPLSQTIIRKMQKQFNQDPEKYHTTHPDIFQKTIDLTRRVMQSEMFFMNQLPDRIDQARSYDEDNVDDMENLGPQHEKTTPVKTKQTLLRMATTECLLNTALHGKFTIVRSDFSWFGPGLSHTSLVTVLKFFGVQKIWIDFFQCFLNAPIKFITDGPTATVQTRKRGVPISHSISELLGEVLLFTMDFAVNQKAGGLFLYRIHDDFWLWDKDEERVAAAWEEMTKFTKLVGLEFNEEKTGSRCIGDGTLHLSLPKGDIKWGFLKFDQTGKFIIDQSQVDLHITELKRQLSAAGKQSIIAWVNVYNRYVSTFFINNFCFPTAHCFGQEHVDTVIATLERIHLAIFPDHQGSVTEYLADWIKRDFDITGIPEGWFYWPICMGGLEVKNPFIVVNSVRGELCKDPNERLDDTFKSEEMEYTVAKEKWESVQGSDIAGSEMVWGEMKKFLSFEEYMGLREQRLTCWVHTYRYLLSEPPSSSVSMTKDIEAAVKNVSEGTGKLTGNGGISKGGWNKMNDYWKWVVALYGPGMVDMWGGLEVVRPGQLPVGMVSFWRSRKVRWEQ
ncbi:hypothetical protein L873DRAFT_1723179 [Choiromyces venosus 120613-1]|uniref:Reverse transcriptase domain-containing protein n=1 Tax=Choiromyces venosus 120613-1 TaxID=1336337 RepID=A0A3N4ISH7_9PEZI|nr:hypothetical protein L873DRAFT_1723179 [Choiromyces venosus 120613-1]